MRIDPVQGENDLGQKYGYVAGEEGGYFFTWHDTLEDTLASLEEDEVDGDGGLEKSEVIEALRSRLPQTKHGREVWSEQ